MLLNTAWGPGPSPPSIPCARSRARGALQPDCERGARAWLCRIFELGRGTCCKKPSAMHLDVRRLLGTDRPGYVRAHPYYPGRCSSPVASTVRPIVLRDWLIRSAAQEATAWSAPLITCDNAIAAYEHGDVNETEHVRRHRIARLDAPRLNYPALSSVPAEPRGGRLPLSRGSIKCSRTAACVSCTFTVCAFNVPSAHGVSVEGSIVARMQSRQAGDLASADELFMMLLNGCSCGLMLLSLIKIACWTACAGPTWPRSTRRRSARR